MALKKPEKKDKKMKKNPYRLSSDRQPGIKKANEKKPKKYKFKDLIEDLKKKKNPYFLTPTPEMKPMPYRPKKDGVPKAKPMPFKPGKDKKLARPMAKGGFTDLSGDGKITKKDVLIGRGVIEKKRGGPVDSPKKKKKKKGFLGIAIDIIRPKTISADKGALAGRLAKRGYGKAKK